MNGMIENLFRNEVGSVVGDPATALLVMGLAFVLGHIIAWIYMWTHSGLSYSQSFTASLVVISVLVSLVMLLMAGNLYIAFGLMAVFAVVRFRNVLKDTRDTTFILWAIIQGMSVGTMKFGIAVTGCACISLVLLYLRLTSLGGRHRFDVVLSLHLAGDDASMKLLYPVLHRHSTRIQLASQRSLTDDLTDLSYRLMLRDPDRSGELLSELEGTEGVAHVSLYHREDESEM